MTVVPTTRPYPRSYLYVPGSMPRRFQSALDSGADAVVFDLEDAVASEKKDFARDAVVEWLGEDRGSVPECWVRINSGPRGLSDLRAASSCVGLSGVVVPKATPTWLAQVVGGAPGMVVCGLVESAVGVAAMSDIAAMESVSRLALGEVDLAADLGMRVSADGRELWPVRLGLVVVAAANGRCPPIGPVWSDVGDVEGLKVSTEALWRRGFGARQVIHPKQVAVVNEEMSVSADELEHAEALLRLAERAGGGATVDEHGRLVDEAVLRSARRVLGAPSGPVAGAR